MGSPLLLNAPDPPCSKHPTPAQINPKYRLVEQPHCDQGSVLGLGVLASEAAQQQTKAPGAEPARQLRVSQSDRLRPAACSPARVGQCFCVCTVEYD